MKNTIKITDSLFGVVVPKDASDFYIKNLGYYGKFLDGKKFEEIKLEDEDWKVHGLFTLPELKFDFEVGSKNGTTALKALILNAIEDSGIDIKDKNILIIEKIG